MNNLSVQILISTIFVYASTTYATLEPNPLEWGEGMIGGGIIRVCIILFIPCLTVILNLSLRK